MKYYMYLLTICIFSFSLFAKEKPFWRYQANPQEYDTMRMETYEIELARALEREKIAKEGIAQEQARIESLKQQLLELDQRIANLIREKYQILGITEQDVINAENEIAAIRDKLNLLLGLPSEELVKRKADIKDCEKRIAALKAKPVSYLWRIRDQITGLEELLARVKANLPTGPSYENSYTVRLIPERRDCLYRIAQYPEIYSDPTKWPTIYTANKPLIDKGYDRYVKRVQEPKYTRPQDLIFPGQVLDIPR